MKYPDDIYAAEARLTLLSSTNTPFHLQPFVKGGLRMVREDEDYEELTNEELYRRLIERFPQLYISPVTNETRNTAIAVLKVIRGPSKGEK